MRLAFQRCKACGSPEVAIYSKTKKGDRGQDVAYSEWRTCLDCRLTRLETPWTEIKQPEPTRGETS